MSNVVIAIVNGAPQSGKTTFQNIIKSYANNYHSDSVVKMKSSVDVMYKAYKMLGWDGIKDDDFRNDMHELKNMYVKNCNGPTRDIIIEAVKLLDDIGSDGNAVIFYDIREEEEINKLIDTVKPLNAIGINCKTILIRRIQVEDAIHGNHADDNVLAGDIKYDIVIDNSGDIDLLKRRIYDSRVFKEILGV